MKGLMAGLAIAATLATAAVAEGEGESALEKAMAKNPERFADMAVDLIAGFGGPAGLRADGIEDHIALERAAARASALRSLLVLDLDGDGAVTRDEMAVSQRAASATARGRMERQFAEADLDRDGQIDAGEIRAAGAAAALRGMGEAEAEVLRALMTLDADGDGALTVAELRAAVEPLDEET